MRNHLQAFDRVVARLGPCEPLDCSLARLQQWACIVPLLSRRATRYGSGRDCLRAAENAGRAATYALRAGRKGDDVTDSELWCELHAILMSGLLPPARCGTYRDGHMLLLEPDGKPLACALPPGRLGAAIQQTVEELRATNGLHPLEAAGLAKLSLIRLHPFADGNGRTARVILEASLVAAGLPPLPLTLVLERRRRDYLNAIRAAVSDANPQPWLALLADAAVDAAVLVGQTRSPLQSLRDDLVAGLTPTLSDREAERLALALLETPFARAPVLELRTRLAPQMLEAALHRLEGCALVRRIGHELGSAWLVPDGLHLLQSAMR